MKMANKRKRQHPLWIILKIGSSIREVIIPIIYFFIINLKSDSSFVKYGSIALIIYMVYRIITILLEWKNNTYLFTEKNLELIEGRLVSKKRYISLSRIQSVQQHTSFLHRLFKLTSLNITTGTTGDNATVKLEMITVNEANDIQNELNKRKLKENEEVIEEKLSSLSEIQQPVEHYKMTLTEIIIISVTSLYFLASIPIIMSIYFKVEDIFSLDQYTGQLFAILKGSWILIGTIIAIGLLVLTCIGIVVTYIRYGNYTVSSDHERIFITRGVFTKTSFSIPKDKVNGITINKGFIRRLFNIVEVELVIVGDLLDETELKTNILFPFISERRAKRLLPQILPTFKMNEEMKPLPSQSLFVILIRPSYLLVIVTVLVFFFWPEYWFVPLALVILIIFSRILEFKRSKYKVDDNYIQMETGSFSTTLFITKREKIDKFAINESWIEQKLGLATLSITTRGQPIYNAKMSHIPVKESYFYYDWYIKEFIHNSNDLIDLQTDV